MLSHPWISDTCYTNSGSLLLLLLHDNPTTTIISLDVFFQDSDKPSLFLSCNLLATTVGYK